MKIVDSRTMGEIDRKSIEDYGIPSPVLMENAGLRVWNAFRMDYPDLIAALKSAGKEDKEKRTDSSAKGIVFLAGRGNNGGDACVMARQAYTDKICNIAVVSWGTRPEEDSTGQKELCQNLGIPLVQWEEEREAAGALIASGSVIIDGLTGTGLKGRARPDLEELIDTVNLSSAVRIAVDIPSGLGDGFRPDFPAVMAETTYTIGLPLTSLYLPAGREFCGRIRVIPICFPREETENPKIPGELFSWNEAKDLVPSPEGKAHKGSRGHLHIYAGSEGTTGAAWLAANSAVRSLAGLVTLHTDRRIYPAVAGSYRSVMVRPWELPRAGDSVGAGKKESVSGSFFLIGPGWGLENPEDRRKWLLEVINDGNSSGVLDADGLTILGSDSGVNSAGGRWIFTPHPGEFSRLTGLEIDRIMEDPLRPVRDYAVKNGVILVLKSHVVYLGFPDGRFSIVDGMNPAMGTGGSGDVLSGIISGFLAAGAAPSDAALAGVCLHQKAGRVLAERAGWFSAEDLIPLIGPILAGKDNSCE